MVNVYEKTVYTFPDEMLDDHTGSFGSGTRLVLSVPFRPAFSPAKDRRSGSGRWPCPWFATEPWEGIDLLGNGRMRLSRKSLLGADFFQYAISGLTIGAIYALVAIGYNAIYSVTEIINFAQGEFVMLGGLFAVFFAGPLAFRFMPLFCARSL